MQKGDHIMSNHRQYMYKDIVFDNPEERRKYERLLNKHQAAQEETIKNNVHGTDERESVHEHDSAHSHTHKHEHENTKAVINRLARAIGHLEHVKKMVENGRDCSEVLIQIAAVRSAVNNVGKLILQDHIQHCVVDAIENNDQETLDYLYEAINRFVK